MEFRQQRASHEQFSIIVDYMETNGDLSRPLPGSQGRLRTEQLWLDLTELLNTVGVGGIQKSVDKWKRVWSDFKTKTKKKAADINRDTQGTGGGPRRARPLNPLEERVLRIIGIGSITGNQGVEEAGFEISHSSEHVAASQSQPAQLSPLVGVPDASLTLEVPSTSEPCIIEVLDVASTHHAAPETSNTGRQ